MKTVGTLAAAMFATCFALAALAGESSQLVTNLKAGKPQIVVTYGTSLTAGGAWVAQLQNALNATYLGLATVINSGQGGMWSKWGVDNLETRIIQKKPDTVFIEFAINDAYLPYKTTVEDAQRNLENMIDRILQANSNTEIVLMTMNPPVGGNFEQRPKFKDYYQMYRDVAKERKLRLIDHCANWDLVLSKDRTLFDKYVPDGIHPLAEGCEKIITPALLKALGLTADPAGPVHAGP